MAEFTLPDLPYAFDALEPHIDALTMQIHHDRHHKAYVDNLNAALAKHPDFDAGDDVDALLRRINEVPEPIRTAVRNNGGGHANHTLFWQIMGPNGGGEPTGALAEAIQKTFGGFSQLKTQIIEAGKARFGSGWSWLVMNADASLAVISTPNQDSPMMDRQYPLFGVDVWEHAYYLKYQNKRPDYLEAWFNTVNWQAIGARYDAAVQHLRQS